MEDKEKRIKIVLNELNFNSFKALAIAAEVSYETLKNIIYQDGGLPGSRNKVQNSLKNIRLEWLITGEDPKNLKPFGIEPNAEQIIRLIIRQEVRSLLEEFLIEPSETRIEKTRLFVKHLVDKTKKPSKLNPKESKRFDLNYDALKRWMETGEVFEVSREILMEFCLNYNIKNKQRRIEDVTEALRFMLTEKITGGPDN